MRQDPVRHLAFGLWAALSAWLLLQLVLGAFVGVWPQAGTDIVVLGALHALVLGCAVYWMAARLVPRSKSEPVAPIVEWQRVLGLHDPKIRALVLGAAVGFFGKLPADAVRALVELRFPTDDLELVRQWSLLQHDTWIQAASLFLVIGFTGPLLEELFYRGALYEQLRRGTGDFVAWLLSSAIFALSHPNVRDWPSLLLVGVVLGDLRRTAGTIWACLGAHVAFNCATLLAVVAGSQSPEAEFVIQWGIVGGAAAMVALLLILARRIL